MPIDKKIIIRVVTVIIVLASLIIMWGRSEYEREISKNFVDVEMTAKVYRENTTPYITSQCYTKVIDEKKDQHNPCYSCHINNGTQEFIPNYFEDTSLQRDYNFPASAFNNRFSNLFKDRSRLVSLISDSDIIRYISVDNYFAKDGSLKLRSRLKQLPKQWDSNHNGQWDGYMPDAYFNFDAQGFDRDPKGNYTGWRAFRYRPFLGTFWPTNGSTDDVLIRLAKPFQEDEKGDFNLTVYKINLAIVESLIKFKDIEIDPVDETLFGVDLDRNGGFNVAKRVVFHKPYGLDMHFVGGAKHYLEADKRKNIARGLYPQGTEFLHSVRYLKSDENGSIKMSPRMKELRWAKKISYNSYNQLSNAARKEVKERHDFPDRTKRILGDTETGLRNGLGWVYQGFIEDKEGELRPQNFEETAYCIGCHSNLGATTDNSFAFARKLEDNESWLHWSQKGLVGITDREIGQGKYEYLHYLEVNKAGDEFRSNEEIKKKFFDKEGTLNSNSGMIKNDISKLILPSHQRALELNKAYKVIVDEQSFIRGRDAHVKALDEKVFKNITTLKTGLTTVESYQ